MKTVFISYRREDTAAVAHRLAARLRELIGPTHVFFDVDSIPIGTDFRQHIRGAIAKCDTVLVLIGPAWSGNSTERLMDPSDYVRLEVEEALARNIPTVPILIGQTQVPTEAMLPEALRPLLYRQAERIDPGVDFDGHVDRLCTKLLGTSFAGRYQVRRKRILIGAGTALGLLVASIVLLAVFWPGPEPKPEQKPEPAIPPPAMSANTSGANSPINMNTGPGTQVVNLPDPTVPQKLDDIEKKREKDAEDQRKRDEARKKQEDEDRKRIEKERAEAKEREYRASIAEDVASIEGMVGITKKDPHQLMDSVGRLVATYSSRNSAKYYSALAICYTESGNPMEARKAFEKAVEFYKKAKDDHMLCWLELEVKPKLPK